MENIGGDYWKVDFQAYPGDKISDKIWTGYTGSKGTPRRAGWEGPITPIGSNTGNTRIFQAGKQDTTLPVQYYNSDAESKEQYWQPFVHKQDSIALYFRVNMGGVMRSGRFDPDINGPVGIRGDALMSGNILDWDSTKIVFQQEQNSVNNASFWSGVCYIPKNKIQAGTKLNYKFFIENDSENGWENNVSNHELIFTSSLVEQRLDTTIHWTYFDNFSPFTRVGTPGIQEVGQFSLKQNYPNPFNNQTIIEYTLNQRNNVLINIYNLQGQLITTLVDEFQQKGCHLCFWNGVDSQGNDLSTGVYFLKMETNQGVAIQKTLLLR